MKRLVTFTLSMGLLLSAIAQNEAPAVKDPKAKKILDELSDKGKSYSSVVASFEYNLLNSDAVIDETQKGTLKLKGKKYRLSIAGQELISNGTKLFTYIPETNEVQVNWIDGGDEESVFDPTKIFNLYESGFKYKYIQETTRNGKATHEIKLFPEDNDKPYHTVVLFINKNEMVIDSMVMKGKDGNTYTYTINSFKTNVQLADSLFTFDLSSAEDVIDFTE